MRQPVTRATHFIKWSVCLLSLQLCLEMCILSINRLSLLLTHQKHEETGRPHRIESLDRPRASTAQRGPYGQSLLRFATQRLDGQ